MWQHASFKLLLIRSNWRSRQIEHLRGGKENDAFAIKECYKKNMAALVSDDLWFYLDVGLMPWQRKETVAKQHAASNKTPKLLFAGPFFRPEFKNHPWRCSSSWENRMPRQSSPFRTFTSCSKLLLSANKPLFSGYHATAIGHIQLFSPCLPVTAHLLLSPCMVTAQRTAVVTFSFATWPYKTERSILYPLWGKWTKKDHLETNRTSLFLLMANLLTSSQLKYIL